MPTRRTPHNCHANALLLGSLLLVAGWLPAAQGQTPPPPPRTVAESSGYRATSLHAEVVGFLDSVAAAAPDAARRVTLGASTEGRELAALVLARPPIESAHAWQSEHGERLLVLAIGNIHGGEVDGKEALLSLARDIAMGEHRDLLNDLAIVILPNYNPDGNERIGPDNRRGQKGPADGMGVRHNAMGLDLNRDFIKADAPETRALITFAREWDPHLFIDAHTTNGSYHRYLITYAGPKAPAGDAAIIEFSRDEFLPRIGEDFNTTTGEHAFWYGNFEGAFSDTPTRTHTRWETFPAEARYATTYFGLRNRLSVLVESYSYAEYEARVRGSHAFILSTLRTAASQRERVRRLIHEADRRASAIPDSPLALRSVAEPSPRPATVLGYVETVQEGRVVVGEPTEHTVTLFDRFVPTLTVPRARAYALGPECADAIDRLALHGIAMHTLRDTLVTDTETWTIETATNTGRLFQGRMVLRLSGHLTPGRAALPAGTVIVPCDQPQGALASYLLEPLCEDGLATWNFFEWAMKPGSRFPVVRIPRD
ncbi:MAG: M14 family metallopeptidase [Phycisphaeraceae bacterium]|nr:M14 family metallopeptidase [Phycisphaeraceae bacterium]